jgi:hypothetical protein
MVKLERAPGGVEMEWKSEWEEKARWRLREEDSENSEYNRKKRQR